MHKNWSRSRDANQRGHFDVGVLRVQGTLPQRARLATPEELGRIVAGVEVACVGIAHKCMPIQGDDTDSLHDLTPRLTAGKIYGATWLDRAVGGPGWLRVGSPIPANVYGSPIVDHRGKILAVYSEAAMIEDGQGMTLHNAAVVQPRAIRMAFGPRSNEVWVTPGGGERPCTIQEYPVNSNEPIRVARAGLALCGGPSVELVSATETARWRR